MLHFPKILLTALFLVAMLRPGYSQQEPMKTSLTRVYKTVDGRELRLFIVQPAAWKASDRRPAIVFFHGGGFVIGSVSKSLSPSLRFGFAAVPEPLVERVTAACSALTPFTSTISAELFTQLVDSGAAERTVAAKRAIVTNNRRAAERALDGLTMHSHAESPHLWIQLPRGVDAHEVAERARARGIAVLPSATFSPDRRPRVEAIRITIGSIDDARRIESAVRTLASLVVDGRLGGGDVV